MEYCYISKLPNDILERIFSKLPITTLLHRCRFVCKSWRDMLCKPDFGKLQLEPCSQLILFLEEEDEKIHWVEFQGRFDQYFHETTEVSFESEPRLVNSCNGLLCVHQNFETNQVLHILNPVTGEYFSLPPYEQYDKTLRKSIGANGCGLGFVDKTKQFKVIRVNLPTDSSQIHAEVFTIGTDKYWRSIGKVLDYIWYPLNSDWRLFDTFVNGSFHFLNNYKSKIYVLDLEEEKFRAFSTPPSYRRYWNCTIGVYENTICSFGFNDDRNFDLWMMKEYGVDKSWIKMLVIEDKRMNLEKPWYLEKVKMLANGDILLFFDVEVCLYNPREESFTTVLQTEFPNHQILHNPSFGSLKDILAVEGLKILNVRAMH